MRSFDYGSCELQSMLRILGPYQAWTSCSSIEGSHNGHLRVLIKDLPSFGLLEQ